MRNNLSLVAAPLAIAEMMNAARIPLGGNANWVGKSGAQQISKEYWQRLSGVSKRLDIPLTAIATQNADEANAVLGMIGVDGPVIDPLNAQMGDFALAAAFTACAAWKAPGTKTNMRVGSASVAAVRFGNWQLKTDTPHCNSAEEARGGTYWIETNAKFRVGVKLAPKIPRDEIELVGAIGRIIQDTERIRFGSMDTSIVLPMLDLRANPNIDHLVGMRVCNEHHYEFDVRKALMRASLQLNQFGIRAAASSGIRLEALGFSQTVTFDQPFYLWLEADDVPVPLFAAYVESDAWREPDPKDIENRPH